MAFASLPGVLGGGEYCRVDLAAQDPFRRSQCIHDLAKCGRTDHQNVNITARALSAAGKRTENRCDPDGGAQRAEGIAHHVGGAGRLAHQVAQFVEGGAVGIGPIVCLVAVALTDQETCVSEPGHLALHRAEAGASQPGDLAQEHAAFWSAKEQREHALAGLTEQRVSDAAG